VGVHKQKKVGLIDSEEAQGDIFSKSFCGLVETVQFDSTVSMKQQNPFRGGKWASRILFFATHHFNGNPQ
jgi:hypothetical protein